MLARTNLHDYQTRAVEHIKANPQSMLWLDIGLGKGLLPTEQILTPGGWKPIGSIQPGELVTGRDGAPIPVTGVYPQPEQPTFKIEFNDGTEIVTDGPHLWAVATGCMKRRGHGWKTKSTEDLLNEGLFNKNGSRKWNIPLLRNPVIYNPVDLPLDPYLLGVILGDGTITKTGYCIVTSDEEILKQYPGKARHHPSEGIIEKVISEVQPELKELGLAGKRSWEKTIPDDYLLGSPADRLALLQGLLDTDGSPITCGGGVEYSSTSESLTDGVCELARSLCGIARKKGPRITNHQNGEGRPSWRVNVKLPSHLNPFRLKRKHDRWIRPTKYQPAKLISNITPCSKQKTICIEVGSPDKLFVTKDFIITHNTVSTLTALSDLIASGHIYGVLILAPLRVCQTVWEQEAGKWHHTKHLSFSLIHGDENHRKRAIRKRRMVYLLNYEGLPGAKVEFVNAYLARGRPLPFNTVVMDESTLVKSARFRQGGKRAAALLFLLQYVYYRIGLTGTPSPNGLLDLFGQYLALDNGYRLGTAYTHYRNSYFSPDQGGYRYHPTKEGKQTIYQRISDVTLQMSAKDYLTLPPVTFNQIEIQLPPKTRAQYDVLERDAFVLLDTGVPITAVNAATVIGKCLQFANGAVYHTPKCQDWEWLHDAKLDALFDIIEELGGNPLLVGYQFKHDAQRIKEVADKRGIECAVINSKVPVKEMRIIQAKWNAGDLPLMIGHGQSLGRGLNLQQSAHHLAWFGLPWCLDIFLQLNGRLARQGQKNPVIVHELLMLDTFDYAVLEAQKMKAKTELELKAAVNHYREMRR